MLSILDASERSDRVGRRPHKPIYALRALTSAHTVIWRRSWACWTEFEAGVTPRLKTAVVFWWRYSPHGSIAVGKGRLIK